MSTGLVYSTTNPRAPIYPACPLCEGHVSVSGCSQCFAPLEVIGSIYDAGNTTRYIGIMGPSGVGKTVYLGMLLDLLSRGAGGLHGVARGSFSLALHRNVMLSLERQRFPEKTPSEPDRWQWVHCEVSDTTRRRVPRVDLVTPDVAGEAVMSEIENPRSNMTVRAVIQRCTALVVLMDTVDVITGGQGQEMFAMQLVTYLDTLQTTRQSLLETPVALVFTKADLCEEPILDADLFAKSHTPALRRLCEARLQKFQFFCSAIAGACGQLVDEDGRATLVPLRVEPRGILEPFSWLMGQLC